MSLKLNRINIKYGAAFVAVSLSLIFVAVVDMLLVNSVRDRMVSFSDVFNVATSEVLNADRDLYQARMAESAYVHSEAGSAQREALRLDFEENAVQAQERIEKFAAILADYPDVLLALEGFEERYTEWLQQAGQSLELADAGESDAAVEHFGSGSLASFDALREMYNQAGEAVDRKVDELGLATQARVRSQQLWVGGFALVVGIAAVLVALIGPHMMSRAIRQVSNRIREITEGDGDLTARIESRRGDEIGELASQFNAFISRMDSTLLSVRESAERVSGASLDISRGAEELASRTEESSANLHETSASMEEITITVRHTADATQQANGLINNAVGIARRGSTGMREVEQTMDKINESSAKIRDIVTLIDGVAFQTNILALNASVEAARAGEHGRGFAVVAQEVRTLAGRCSDASHEIRDLVEASVGITRSGAEQVVSAGRTMEEIVQSIEKVTAVIQEISTGAEEQSKGIGQVNTAVAELDVMTQHNASMVEGTATAAEQMRQQAHNLMALLSSFRLGQQVVAEQQDAEIMQRDAAAAPRALPSLKRAA
ncbi:methyl-accepting chemotaxis protein [Parahaliea aestuarii]|uniref:HAMP domain-containing protein n=1 Tax=Parahaliea aestuarii TaxID=1852021 RepID=A0A5C9A1J0_9GAMM|nr:methyl-accepting chemotaxis protein [Parahaliea aestuarii]TXS94586.1 HAMP domain-containing protein [Parahaliea aestuarii]